MSTDIERQKEAIHKNISERLNRLTSKKGITQQSMADVLGVNKTMVSRLINEKGKVPPLDLAVRIAQMLGITLEALTEDTEVTVDQSITLSYAKAFFTIWALTERGLIKPDSRDPFLLWLLKKRNEIEKMPRRDADMQKAWEEKVLAWERKVLRDYSRPLLPRYLTQFTYLFLEAYPDIEDYDTYLGVFNLFQGYMEGNEDDTQKVNGLIQKWRNDLIDEKGCYNNIPVPWDGEEYVELDKDGNEYVTEKPKYVALVPDLAGDEDDPFFNP